MPMPKYQRSNLNVASMPGVTSIGYQEAARTGQTLSAAMDRVTSFAFRQIEAQKKIEGAEYGAVNAPTQKQLADALAAGQDPAALIPGADQRTTVFGSAAYSQAIASVSTAMELEASSSIVKLQGQFEAGDITLADFQANLQSLVSEQTKIMGQIDPIAATKFSAAIGTTSNAAYLSAAKTEASNQRKDMEVRYRSGVDTYIRNAETIVRAGPTVGADGTVVTVDQKIEVIRDQIRASAQEINDPEFYQTKMNELDKAVSDAKIGVVMDEALQNPERALKIIAGQGSFKDIEVQATLESMNNKDVRELYSQIQGALSTELALESAKDAKIERLRGNVSKDIQGNITKALLDGDMDAANTELERLRLVDPEAYASKAITISTTPGIDDPSTITTLRRKSLNNILTAGDIDTAYQSGKMSLSTYKEFTSDLENQRNQAYTEAVDWLKLDRGLPSGTLLNFSAVQREADREVAAIKKDLITALNKDPAIDPMQYVQDKVAELVKTKGGAADRIKREQAEKLLDELRIGTKNQNLTAQQALDLLNSDPKVYPNEQKRRNAIENLLPVLIEIEAK